MNNKSILLTAALLLLVSQVAIALDVTIVARVPYEHLDATGQADGANMTTPGTKYTYVQVQDGNVILIDPAGGNIMVQMNATDYVPPRPSPIPETASPKPKAQPTPTPVPTQSPLDAETTKVNQMLGIPLFDANNLWDEKASDVGARLGWNQDSISSYRLYDDRPALRLHMAESDTSEDSADDAAAKLLNASTTPPADPSVTVDLLGKTLINFLNSHAYCATLYTRNGKPDFLSLIFANNGDLYDSTQQIHLTEEDITKIITRDSKALQKVMTDALGDFTNSGFGASSSVRLPAKRWDWKGTSFLLIHSPGRYVGIVICSTDFADSHGIRSDRDSNAVRASLPNNVKKGSKGDVYLEGVPYVDQGDKGYCFPACWERYLRYLDIPSDMYFFATAGDQQFGGLVNANTFRSSLNDYLETYQTHIQMLNSNLSMDLVSKEIDSGHPIMWQSWDIESVEKTQLNRSKLRVSGDWNNYLAQINIDKTKLRGLPKIDPYKSNLVLMRLIIGYNAKTNEIAVSDCFLKGERRWFTLAEAQALDSGDLTVLE